MVRGDPLVQHLQGLVVGAVDAPSRVFQRRAWQRCAWRIHKARPMSRMVEGTCLRSRWRRRCCCCRPYQAGLHALLRGVTAGGGGVAYRIALMVVVAAAAAAILLDALSATPAAWLAVGWAVLQAVECLRSGRLRRGLRGQRGIGDAHAAPTGKERKGKEKEKKGRGGRSFTGDSNKRRS